MNNKPVKLTISIDIHPFKDNHQNFSNTVHCEF